VRVAGSHAPPGGGTTPTCSLGYSHGMLRQCLCGGRWEGRYRWVGGGSRKVLFIRRCPVTSANVKAAPSRHGERASATTRILLRRPSAEKRAGAGGSQW